MRNIEYVEAHDFLEKSRECLANGYDNEGALNLVEEFQELGCKVFAEVYDVGDEDEDLEFDAVLFVHLPKKVTADIVVAIALSRADEVSEEEPGVLRLWWD